MGFQIKKISNHGTSNPIVARLTIQTHELLGFCTIHKGSKDEILKLYHDDVMPRLITCDTIAQKLAKNVLEVVSRFGKKGLVVQAQGRAVEVPQIMDLQQDAEQFLNSAKKVLRDSAKVFKPLFGKEFKAARFDQVIVWAKGRFGDVHEITRMITEDQDLWIKRLIDMRNAAEHPDTLRLNIHNVELVGDKLAPPSWHLNEEPPVDMAQDMLRLVENMLTFCEDLLAAGIQAAGIMPCVGFALIPEKDRNSHSPMRLKPVRILDKKK